MVETSPIRLGSEQQKIITQDKIDKILTCPEKENLCIFDVNNYSEKYGKEPTIGEIKERYGIPDKVLTKNEAGKKNDFYISSNSGIYNYDELKPSEAKKILALIFSPLRVYIPKDVIETDKTK